MKILLDTNAYSRFKQADSQVIERVREAEHVILSAVVVGELMNGFRSGNRFSRNASELREFLDRPVVSLATVTSDTADWFGRVASTLRKKGTSIPTNDIWIAAHSMENAAE